MENYAVHNGKVVVNVVTADSAEIVTSITGLAAVKTNGEPWIGWTLYENEWRPPMPIIGVWEWDEATREWIDVTPEPESDAAPEE